MGQVLLVRHGQASWGAEDYDVLSPLGEQQSETLGQALARLMNDAEPDLLVHGTMQRQRRTAELAAKAAGWSVDPTVDERWNEMDHLAVLAVMPRDFEGEPDRGQFQAWFEAAAKRWASGEHDDDYDESFPAFRARVRDGLEALAGVRTAVLLEAGDPTYQRLAPVVVNSSVTRVVSGRRGLTLVSFNDHAHLPAELLTYR
jgi:broad specificity phosphatase PhoE